MDARVRPAGHACTQCRLTFPTGHGLRRHRALDHRPAPDGARLTALLVAGQPSQPGPRVPPPTQGAGAPTVLADAPPPAGPELRRDPVQDRPPVGPVLVGTALAVVLMLVAAGPLPALVLSVLVWSHWVRWHVLPPRPAADRDPPPPSPDAP